MVSPVAPSWLILCLALRACAQDASEETGQIWRLLEQSREAAQHVQIGLHGSWFKYWASKIQTPAKPMEIKNLDNESFDVFEREQSLYATRCQALLGVAEGMLRIAKLDH